MTGTIYQRPRVAPGPGETVVTSTCGHNCGGRCVVNAHVVDDRIVQISTDPARWQPELPPLHACARGVGQIERIYHPDRLQYPLRRIGPARLGPVRAHLVGRGARPGRARDAARARTLRQCRRSSTPRARATSRCCTGGGVAKRFLYKFGGCTELWSNMSAEAEIFAVRMTFGAKADYKSAGREPTDYVNSKLILMWGWSPGDGTFGTGTYQYLQGGEEAGRAHRLRRSAPHADQRGAGRRAHLHQALDRCRRADRHGLRDRERGSARPGLSATATCWASTRTHLPPGAPAGASYRSYLLGVSDGVPKTPEWAADDHRHPGRDHPPAGDRVRHHQAGGAAMRLRAGPHGLRRAVPSRRLRAGGDHRQCRHRGRQLRRQQRRHRAHAASRACRPGANPIDARVASPLLADLLARGKAAATRPTSS